MGEHKSAQDSMSIVSVSSPSNASSIMLTLPHQQRLSDVTESVNRGILVAQKRSVETALKEAQIAAERDLKRARMEYHSLASEKAGLEIRLKNLEQRLQDSNETNEELHKRLEASKKETESRIASMFTAYKHEDGLAQVKHPLFLEPIHYFPYLIASLNLPEGRWNENRNNRSTVKFGGEIHKNQRPWNRGGNSSIWINYIGKVHCVNRDSLLTLLWYHPLWGYQSAVIAQLTSRAWIFVFVKENEMICNEFAKKVKQHWKK